MSSILYYSNYCNNCKNLLSEISKSNIKNDIHFISIDKRINKNNSTYIILENNEEILLPHTVNAVPALLLINDNYKVLSGIQPQTREVSDSKGISTYDIFIGPFSNMNRLQDIVNSLEKNNYQYNIKNIVG